MKLKRAQLEGIEIPEQNLDYILGFIGGGVQIAATFKSADKPAIVEALQKVEHQIIEAILHTPEGNIFSGIYSLDEVKIQKLAAYQPPLWKLTLQLKRQ